MARLISDGPGYQFLQKNCATKPYVVCNYIDRLPIPSSTFLWSMIPNEGVFNVANLPTRRALSSEQASFIFDVFRSDPMGVISSATKNFIQELLTVRLNEFFLPNPQILQSSKGNLPDVYFNGLLHSHIIYNDWILVLGNALYSWIYFLSMIGLVLIMAFWPLAQFQMKSDLFPQPQWFHMLTIAITGIVFNAAICGALSEPSPRYQTRISWIPLFVLCLMIANLWKAPSTIKMNLSSRPLRM
jgi:hypothetical protein